MAHQALPLSHATGLYMRFWWVNFVGLGVMYANLVLAESLDSQLHNYTIEIQQSKSLYQALGRLPFFSHCFRSLNEPSAATWLIAKTDQGHIFLPITPKCLQITYVESFHLISVLLLMYLFSSWQLNSFECRRYIIMSASSGFSF